MRIFIQHYLLTHPKLSLPEILKQIYNNKAVKDYGINLDVSMTERLVNDQDINRAINIIKQNWQSHPTCLENCDDSFRWARAAQKQKQPLFLWYSDSEYEIIGESPRRDALKIVDFLAKTSIPVAIEELSYQLKINPTNLGRKLSKLVDEHYVLAEHNLYTVPKPDGIVLPPLRLL